MIGGSKMKAGFFAITLPSITSFDPDHSPAPGDRLLPIALVAARPAVWPQARSLLRMRLPVASPRPMSGTPVVSTMDAPVARVLTSAPADMMKR